jgi:hypothetical protein
VEKAESKRALPAGEPYERTARYSVCGYALRLHDDGHPEELPEGFSEVNYYGGELEHMRVTAARAANRTTNQKAESQ